MRLLQVNKFHYPRGGADKYFLFLEKSLRAAGHEVAVFSMAHPDNEASPWQDYFVSKIDFERGTLKDKLKTPGRVIYSLEAKKKFTRLLEAFRPDLIHCHNIYHQLSPSILSAAKEKRIPIIMHLHDYKLICPNYRLFINNEFCRLCLDKKSYWPCVKKNCYSGRGRSFLAALEMGIHHRLLKIYEKNIDLLLAPSRFIADLTREAGWPKEKIRVLMNPAPAFSPALAKEGDYLFYFGRLAAEKGVDKLLGAVKATPFKLRIAGRGPLEAGLKKEAAAEIKSGKIKFLGERRSEDLNREIDGAAAVVLPSLWPENMPLALLEALARGKIIIASRTGGLPEIIRENENGFLFTPGNIQELSAKIKLLLNLPAPEKARLRAGALAIAKRLNPENHLRHLEKIYKELAKKSE